MVHQLFDTRPLFIQNPRIVLICLFAAISRVMSVGSHTSDPPQQRKAAEQTQAEAKENAILTHAVIGAKQLHDSMRNPGSFKLSKVLVIDDGAVCYSHRAQNGFGGLNVGDAVLTPGGKFKTSEDGGVARPRSKECAEKTGSDKTFAVDLLMLTVPAS
jgi:hypothetical protein